MYPNNFNYYSQPQSSLNNRQLPYQQIQSQQQYTLKGRPVSSFEEVRAMVIDFDGSICYFPDLSNKCIYTKQIGMDGSAIFNMYELKEMPVNTNQEQTYITRKEFDSTISQLTAMLKMVQPIQSQEQQIIEKPEIQTSTETSSTYSF